MSTAALYAGAGVVLFVIAAYGLWTVAHLVRKIIALNLMGSAICLVIVALGARAPGSIDPVPQALVLTGIVVAVSATAYGLALVRRLYEETGALELRDDD